MLTVHQVNSYGSVKYLDPKRTFSVVVKLFDSENF